MTDEKNMEINGTNFDAAQAPQQEAAQVYQRYYEPQGGTEPAGHGRRGAGGYILTAVISLIVGILIGLLFGGGSAKKPGGPVEGIIPFSSHAPAKTPKPAAQAEPTPLPTPRPAPALDGQAPVISNSVNPIPDIVEQVSPGVIGVNGYVRSELFGREMTGSLGSGFIISREGYILTCAHIISGMDNITVTLADGTEVDAEVMGADKSMDVAVLKIEQEDVTPLKIGDPNALRVGDFVVAIGDPTGRELAGTTTFGIVSAISREVNIDGMSNIYIQTDAAVNPGSSGGALLNMLGEVVGLTSAKTVTADYDEFGNAISAEGLGFATPIDLAMETAMQLITKGYIQRPGIGISVMTMDEESAKEYEVPTGIVVYSITKDGPGDKAGLKVNDILLSCDGQPLTEQDAFVDYIKSKRVGDTLQLKVWRGGKEIEVQLTLADLNSLGDDLAGDYADFNFGGE